MKIAVTADLHYEHSDASRAGTEAVAQEICALDADALVIAGDTFAFEPEILRACLNLFKGFGGAKCLVPGNHDIWVQAGGDSWRVHEETIPAVASECGFHCLDQEPLVMGEVALVGNMGWYDYSLRDVSLGLPLRFYEHKIAPGAAAVIPSARRLVEAADDIADRVRGLTAIWNDLRFVQWPFMDAAAAQLMADRISEHLALVEPRVEAIVCVTHHVPFENMVHRYDSPKFAFTNAFMGSTRLGDAMLACPKVRMALCGHNHRPCRTRNGPIECINVGGTYPHKRFEVVEIA